MTNPYFIPNHLSYKAKQIHMSPRAVYIVPALLIFRTLRYFLGYSDVFILFNNSFRPLEISLKDDSIANGFREFMSKEMAVENLDFLLEVLILTYIFTTLPLIIILNSIHAVV